MFFPPIVSFEAREQGEESWLDHVYTWERCRKRRRGSLCHSLCSSPHVSFLVNKEEWWECKKKEVNRKLIKRKREINRKKERKKERSLKEKRFIKGTQEQLLILLNGFTVGWFCKTSHLLFFLSLFHLSPHSFYLYVTYLPLFFLLD